MPLSQPRYHDRSMNPAEASRAESTPATTVQEVDIARPPDRIAFTWPQALERPGIADLPFLFKALEKRVQDLEVRMGLNANEITAVSEAAQAGAELDLKHMAHLTPERKAALDRMMHVEKEMVKVQAQRSRAVQELQNERENHSPEVLKLEQLHRAKESIFDDRMSALQQVHRAEQERAQMAAEKEHITHELEKHKGLLKKAKPGHERVDLESKLNRLEADLAAKVALSKGLDAALAKVSEAEQEREKIYSENAHHFAELEWRKSFGKTADDAAVTAYDDANKDATNAKIDKLAAEFRQESSFMHDMTTRLHLRLAEMSEMLTALMEGGKSSRFPRSFSHHSKHSGTGQGEGTHSDYATSARQLSDMELLVRVREGLGDIGLQLNRSASRLATNGDPPSSR